MTKHLIKLAFLALAACKPEAAPPPDPVAMTPAAVVHYCQMSLLEHPGPKAQVHLEGNPAPLFFSQMRDAIAYARMPEQAAPITAIHVSDMARAISWDQPRAENWMPLEDAIFVVGSRRDGGMGVPETVPFSARPAAAAFAAEWGGRLMTLDEIPDAEVLGAADKPGAAPEPGDDADYLTRLRALTPAAETTP